MNVLIVEDEFAASENIQSILRTLDSSINILASLDTVNTCVAWLKSNPAPDLIFMDIQLADGISFNIFECVRVETPVIFTTAYDKYAIRAFQVNSIDYLLKPISIDAVTRSLEKYKRLTQTDIQKYFHNLETLIKPKEYLQRILVAVHDKIIPVKTGQIAFIYNTSGTTQLFTKDGKEYQLDKSLDSIAETLDPSDFYRANRQFILSKDVIESITLWFDSRLLINLSVEAPERVYVSRNKAAGFKKWFAST